MIELLNSTDNQKIDEILKGTIGIFETVFPNRIRGYYLKGSYADGSAVSTSDVDVDIVFKDTFKNIKEQEKVQQTGEYCSQMSSVDLELNTFGEAGSFRWGFPDLKLSSILLYGEDIRDCISLMPIERYVSFAMHVPYRFLVRVRGNPNFLSYPMEYPDPDAEFYGYDCRELLLADGTVQAGVKELTNCVGKPMLAIVAHKARIFLKNRRDCLKQYRHHINDNWMPLINDIFGKCRDEWDYRIPTDKDGRTQLKAICEQVLDFENHFLALHKDFLLSELDKEAEDEFWLSMSEAMTWWDLPKEFLQKGIRNGEIQTRTERGEKLLNLKEPFKILAVKALGKIIYPDTRIAENLRDLSEGSEKIMRKIVQDSLSRIQEASN